MRVLIFGAHPDDIEIGVGGTAAKYVKNGHEVLGVVVTVPNNKDTRKKEAEQAAKILGIELMNLDIDPNELSYSRRLVRKFDSIISSYNPDIIFTHWHHDSHQDHVSISKATVGATRKNKCPVYMYEQNIPGGIVPHGFRAQMYVDISSEIDLKIESTLAHVSQVKEDKKNWISGIEGRASYRGFQLGVDYAEAFEVIKDILKIEKFDN